MKASRFVSSILYIGLAVILLFGSISTATATINVTCNENIYEIQTLLDHYFQLRYEARKNNIIPDLSQFIDVSSEKVKNFLSTETDKLRLETLHASKNDLEYLEYKFIIDIQNIDFSSEDSTVTVIILENHEVVFKKTPQIVSKMNNLIHQIVLSPNDRSWEIIDDSYDDFLWKAIRQTSVDFIEEQINTPRPIGFIQKVSLFRQEGDWKIGYFTFPSADACYQHRESVVQTRETGISESDGMIPQIIYPQEQIAIIDQTPKDTVLSYYLLLNSQQVGQASILLAADSPARQQMLLNIDQFSVDGQLVSPVIEISAPVSCTNQELPLSEDCQELSVTRQMFYEGGFWASPNGHVTRFTIQLIKEDDHWRIWDIKHNV